MEHRFEKLQRLLAVVVHSRTTVVRLTDELLLLLTTIHFAWMSMITITAINGAEVQEDGVTVQQLLDVEEAPVLQVAVVLLHRQVTVKRKMMTMKMSLMKMMKMTMRTGILVAVLGKRVKLMLRQPQCGAAAPRQVTIMNNCF